jgi:hypothetical protein
MSRQQEKEAIERGMEIGEVIILARETGAAGRGGGGAGGDDEGDTASLLSKARTKINKSLGKEPAKSEFIPLFLVVFASLFLLH